MTLRLDADYNQEKPKRPDAPRLGDLLAKACKRYEYEFEISDLNSAGWGDVMFMGIDGVNSGEIKGAGEFLSGMDHCEKQLAKQIPNCHAAFLLIYGRMEPAADGNVYVYGPELSMKYLFNQHPQAKVLREHKRRYHNVNYLGARTKLARFRSLGIDVYEVPSIEAAVTELLGIYKTGTTQGKTLNRLIPENFVIKEEDKQRRDFMLTLMGIQGAGIGEEVADAIASWLESYPIDLNLSCLIQSREAFGTLATQPLRSSLLPGARKRTIGPAAVGKLKAALGV